MNISFLSTDAENPKAAATDYPNAARTWCDKLFAGKTGGGPAPYLYCDFMNVIMAATRGRQSVDPATLLAGIEGLGTSIVGTGDYGATYFGPGRDDGGAAVRVMEWDPTISDFRFITGPLRVP